MSVGREAAVRLASYLDTVVQCLVYHGWTCGWGKGRSEAPSKTEAPSPGSTTMSLSAPDGTVADASGGISSLAAYSTAVSELHPQTDAAVRRTLALSAAGPEARQALNSVWDREMCETEPKRWGLDSVASSINSAATDPNALLAMLRSQWREGARLMERSDGAWTACHSHLIPLELQLVGPCFLDLVTNHIPFLI